LSEAAIYSPMASTLFEAPDSARSQEPRANLVAGNGIEPFLQAYETRQTPRPCRPHRLTTWLPGGLVRFQPVHHPHYGSGGSCTHPPSMQNSVAPSEHAPPNFFPEHTENND